MSVVLTIAGQTFDYPSTSDDNWGSEATDWAVAVSTGLLQRTGGTFTLTNDVNFGASFATIQAYLKSRSTNIASAGFVRMAKGDQIVWRNNNNDGNIVLAINGSDEVTINGTPVLLSPGGVLAVADGGTGLSSYTIGDLIYASGATTLSKLGIGTTAYLMKSTGSAPSWGLLVDANVDAAAAMARSKLANGSNNHVLINNESGVMSSEAQLAGTRGGTGVSSTATFPTSGVVVTEAASETLTNKTLTTPVVNESVVSKVNSDSPYTIAATNYLVLNDCTAGAITNTLPAASTSVGKIYKIKKVDSTFNAVTVARAGSDTIIDVASGLTSTTLNTQGEEIEIIGATSSTWQVLSRKIPSIVTAYTPTGAWVANTTYTGFWKRLGDSIECEILAATTGVPTTAALTASLPSGLTIDTAKLTTTTSLLLSTDARALDAAVQNYILGVFYSSTTVVSFATLNAAGTNLVEGNQVNQAAPFSFNTGDSVWCRFTVPVSGWNG